MNKYDSAGNGDSAWQATFASASTAAWDPYEVWLTRVKQPRESGSGRRITERPSERDVVSPSAAPSPGVRWSPLRRATSPRS